MGRSSSLPMKKLPPGMRRVPDGQAALAVGAAADAEAAVCASADEEGAPGTGAAAAADGEAGAPAPRETTNAAPASPTATAAPTATKRPFFEDSGRRTFVSRGDAVAGGARGALVAATVGALATGLRNGDANPCKGAGSVMPRSGSIFSA